MHVYNIIIYCLYSLLPLHVCAKHLFYHIITVLLFHRVESQRRTVAEPSWSRCRATVLAKSTAIFDGNARSYCHRWRKTGQATQLPQVNRVASLLDKRLECDHNRACIWFDLSTNWPNHSLNLTDLTSHDLIRTWPDLTWLELMAKCRLLAQSRCPKAFWHRGRPKNLFLKLMASPANQNATTTVNLL